MEKILLAIDALNPDQFALEFACYLGRFTKSKVTGVFLENLVADESLVIKQIHGNTYVGWEVDEKSEQFQTKVELTEKHIALFKEGCIKREVCFSVHLDGGVPARELIEESRFADVMVIDAETSFNKSSHGVPSEFVRDILKKAECPVIIAPEDFDVVDEIVFTYNDSASSVFAIKQFTYLFPQLRNKKVSIIQVNETGEWPEKDKYKFTEWLQGHYTDLHFEALKGKAKIELLKYLVKRENIFLVTGAYGRKDLSLLFHRSPADLLIKILLQPIFIAHM